MKKYIIAATALLTMLTPASAWRDSFKPHNPMTLWYELPAKATGVSNPWMEYSLPIGNGELGASLYGGVYEDEIQFNEKSLWTGTPTDMQGYGSGYGQYKNFGSIIVRDLSGCFIEGQDAHVRDYWRSLDIEEGIARVHYLSANGATTYEREYLSSSPDGVIAVRYRAIGPDRLHLQISLVPGEDINATEPTYKVGADAQPYAQFHGSLQTISYHAHMRAIPQGGQIRPTSQGLEVTDATSVVIYLSAGTDFSPEAKTRTQGITPQQLAKRHEATVERASAKGYERIMSDHINDFTSYTHRVRLNLGFSKKLMIDICRYRTTPQLIDHYNTLDDLTSQDARYLEQLYFNYGRYLAISSNRKLQAPNNLQGIWNNQSNAPWNADIHTNINIQMNYWPTEPTNLSELHLPLLNYIIRNASDENWHKAATTYAGVRNGWTVFTESSLFGGMSIWGSNYFVANAWYCSHLWQHYRYTRDEQYLEKAFPAMWSCAQFWFERLKRAPDGTYEAPDEYSPEQNAHPKEDATAHAQQLIYDLFTNVDQAQKILGSKRTGLTSDDIARLKDYLVHTDQGLHIEPYTANSAKHPLWTNPRNGIHQGDPILREWKYATYDASDDPNHRHMSHLMALYPLTQIAPSSPYFQPAVNSLKLRGDQATGWSMGWKVNLWARALDGDHAHQILHNALRHSTDYGCNEHAGGIYYNLYDAHAPFQIDGNFGCSAGIAEMLLQSHTDTLQLLPALPSTWRNGKIEGLKAIGNFTVDQTWEQGQLTLAIIESHAAMPLYIKYKDITKMQVINDRGRKLRYKTKDPHTIIIPTTRKGDKIIIKRNDQ